MILRILVPSNCLIHSYGYLGLNFLTSKNDDLDLIHTIVHRFSINCLLHILCSVSVTYFLAAMLSTVKATSDTVAAR